MKAIIILIHCLGALFCSITSFAQPYQVPETLNPTIKLDRVNIDNNTLHYAYSGADDKPGVLFVHGTPGGWGAFEVYLSNPVLQDAFFMVSVDRLGWGASQVAKGRAVESFAEQAESIGAVMDAYPNKKWIVVGHSLGASLGPQIALSAPDQVQSLLLLAGSLNPKLGSPRWYNWAASTWLAQWILPGDLNRSNREIMALRKQLKRMSEEIQATKLDAKLVVMQGGKDKLVSPKNPSYVKQQWLDHFNSIEIINLAEEGHFLPWRQTPLVVSTLLKLASPPS